MTRAPEVAFQSGRLRFFDATGRAWTVYDVRRVNGRIRKTAPAGEAATWRVFVDADGRRVAYPFGSGDTRELDPEVLAKQLARAQRCATFRPNRRGTRR